MLFWYGFGLGLQSLARRYVTREVIKNIVVPVNYWRTLEYKLVYHALDPHDGDRILDVGSPKLIAFYLADKCSSAVHSIDIEDYFIRDYLEFQRMRKISEDRFRPYAMDGRHLAFAACSFNKIFSISVLEHIPDTGDTACIKEMARVLDHGGKCVVTVPFSPVSEDEFRDPGEFYWARSSAKHPGNGKVFFQRRYDEQAIFERLVRPSGLHLSTLSYVGEKIRLSGHKEIGAYLPRILGPLHPALSHLIHTSPTDSWHRLKKPLAAFLVLEKQ